jgi:hypothetical protein
MESSPFDWRVIAEAGEQATVLESRLVGLA